MDWNILVSSGAFPIIVCCVLWREVQRLAKRVEAIEHSRLVEEQTRAERSNQAMQDMGRAFKLLVQNCPCSTKRASDPGGHNER